MLSTQDLLLKEILEQPVVLEHMLDIYFNKINNPLEEIRKKIKGEKYSEVIFTGMGSSLFASYSAASYMNENGVRAFTCDASELLHYNLNCISKHTLVVAVSQSGESAETKKVVDKIRKMTTVIGVVNEVNSHIYRAVQIPLLIHAGVEEMPSTKTHINTLTVLLLLSAILTNSMKAGFKDDLYKVLALQKKLLKKKQELISLVMNFWKGGQFLTLIGRGPSWGAAMQGSLILKEAVQLPSEGINAGHFRHGPIEAVDKRFRAVVFAPAGRTRRLNMKLTEDIIRFGGRVLLFGNQRVNFGAKDLYCIKTGIINEFLSPLLNIIPVEFLMLAIAVNKRLKNAGRLTQGSKVTVTE